MITAIDSSVLWAIVKDESTSQGWLDLLARQASEGSLVICPIVFAELAPSSADSKALASFLFKLRGRRWFEGLPVVAP